MRSLRQFSVVQQPCLQVGWCRSSPARAFFSGVAVGAPTQFPRGLCAARLATFWQSAGSLPFSPRKGKRKGKLQNIGRRGQETRLPPEVWLEVLFARPAAAGARMAFSAVLLAPAGQHRDLLRCFGQASRRSLEVLLDQGGLPEEALSGSGRRPPRGGTSGRISHIPHPLQERTLRSWRNARH